MVTEGDLEALTNDWLKEREESDYQTDICKWEEAYVDICIPYKSVWLLCMQAL